MFKKKDRQFRTKKAADAQEDEEPSAEPQEPSKSAANKPKPSGLLSFGDEVEEEPGIRSYFASHTSKDSGRRPKKEKRDKKEKKEKDRIFNRAVVAEAPPPGTPGGREPERAPANSDYTPEKLEALRKNTMSFTGRRPAPPPAAAVAPAAKAAPIDVDRAAVPGDSAGDDMDMDTEQDQQQLLHRAMAGGAATVLNAAQIERMEEAEDEEDEEFKRWEMAQIRKGGGGAFSQPAAPSHERANGTASAVSHVPASVASSGPLTVEEIDRRMAGAIAHIDERHALHSRKLSQAQHVVSESQKKLESMESEFEAASREYMFFQEMQDYVADICDCLSVKAPVIEECEEELVRLDIERMERLRKLSSPAELGWSDDSLNPKIDSVYSDARSALLKRAEDVFADTADDFASIKAVKSKFEKWKFEHGGSYKQAYCSMSVPQLFAPFARLELLRWDPIYSDAGFDTMSWYTQLMDYGIKEGHPIPENDPDGNLVPNLIEKVVLPRVNRTFTHCWTPRSKLHNRRALSLIKSLVIYVPPEHAAMKEVLTSILVSIAGAVDDLPPIKGPDAERRFTQTVALLQHMAAWHPYLQPDPLQRLAMESVLNSKLVPYLSSIPTIRQTIDALEKIVRALPSEWMTAANLSGRLAVLHNAVMTVVRQLELEKNFDLLTKVVRCLKDMNDTATVSQLATKHRLRV